MKKFTFQMLLLLLVIFASLYFYKNQSVPNIPFMPQPTVTKNLTINGALLKVEIADTKEKRSKGLGGRESLATDSGMLFIFEKLDKYAFWMKGLSFPLDFIWIKGDRVMEVTQDVKPPLPGQSDESLPIYSSKVDIDKVLEVNSGMANQLNIKEGSIIKLE